MRNSRIYHHHDDMEEFKSNMWKICSSKEIDEMIEDALLFMNDLDSFFDAMMLVTYEWKNSCEANLSNKNMNRVAWIGQAACALARRIPEEVTRSAWGLMDDKKRFEANKKAELAIASWEQNRRKTKCLKNQLELMF